MKWSLLKGGSQEAILKGWKIGRKDWSMPNDTNWTEKSMTTGLVLVLVMNMSQSQDFNNIRAVCDHLDTEWNKMQPTSKEDPWNVLQKTWRTIPEDYLRQFQDSMSKMIQTVLKNKDDHTKDWHSSLSELHTVSELCFSFFIYCIYIIIVYLLHYIILYNMFFCQ